MPESKNDIRVDYISVREFSRRLGLKSHNSVIEAMDSGVISKGIYVHPGNKHRKIIYDIAIEEWDIHHNNKEAVESPQEKRGGGNSTGTTLVSVRLQSAKVKLAQDTLKLRKLKGELVEKDLVYKELFEFGRLLRDSLLVIPDRITDQLVAANDRHEVHSIITDALVSSLESLSDIKNLKV